VSALSASAGRRAGDRDRAAKPAARAHDEECLSCFVQSSACSRACLRLFGPEAVTDVVVLREQGQPRLAVHGMRPDAEQQAWFVELVVDFAAACRAVGGCW
jgi:hypothetical protein